jgi:hypothetical protein
MHANCPPDLEGVWRPLCFTSACRLQPNVKEILFMLQPTGFCLNLSFSRQSLDNFAPAGLNYSAKVPFICTHADETNL